MIEELSNQYPDVPLKINGYIRENLDISTMDVCTIFSNVLENAFEAAVKSEERAICITFREMNNKWMTVVENSFANPISFKGDNVISTKRTQNEVIREGWKEVL